MEPFGVLNLIRSILETNQKAEETPPPSTEKTDPEQPPQSAQTPMPPSQNSYLAFAQAHEERARKLRK